MATGVKSARRDRPHDIAAATPQLDALTIIDTIATTVEDGHLDRRLNREERERAQSARARRRRTGPG